MTEMPEDATDVHWSRLREDVGVVIWSSFLVACLATMLFFAFVDPVDLAELLQHPWWLPNDMTTYALGFFGFWGLAACSATLTAYMLDTSHEHFAAPHKDEYGAGTSQDGQSQS